MEILDVEMPPDWLSGAKRMWITSTPYTESENGIIQPVEQQPRPLLHFTFDTVPEIMQELEDLFNLCNGPTRGFLCKPPLLRDYLQIQGGIGTGTGSPTEYPLRVGRGIIWNITYPDEDTIIVYFDGVEQPPSPSVWTLGDEGLITVTAPNGADITVTFEYWTPFMFTEQSLETNLVTEDLQHVKSITIRELFV